MCGVGWGREEGSGCYQYGHVIATDMLSFPSQWETNTALVVRRVCVRVVGVKITLPKRNDLLLVETEWD